MDSPLDDCIKIEARAYRLLQRKGHAISLIEAVYLSVFMIIVNHTHNFVGLTRFPRQQTMILILFLAQISCMLHYNYKPLGDHTLKSGHFVLPY